MALTPALQAHYNRCRLPSPWVGAERMIDQQVSDPEAALGPGGLGPASTAAEVLTGLARLGAPLLVALSEAGILRRAGEWLLRCDARCCMQREGAQVGCCLSRQPALSSCMRGSMQACSCPSCLRSALHAVDLGT